MKKHFAIAILLILVFAVSISTVLAETPITQSFDTIGSIVTFGCYEQDGDKENGPEEIEWVVLDVQDGKALLLSKYGLEAKPYNTEYTDVTGETCTLRAWLNSDFLNKAFSAEEQSAILTTTVDNSSSQGYNDLILIDGNNTQDKIFLLSYAEANKYFGAKYSWLAGSDHNRVPHIDLTAYVMAQDSFIATSQTIIDGELVWWWLRSIENSDHALVVLENGSIVLSEIHGNDAVVRPAFWLNLAPGSV